MIFIDYNGMMAGRPHNGSRAFPIPSARSVDGNTTMILKPGAQGVDIKLWNAARTCYSIGWTEDDKGGRYKSSMWAKGELKELPANKAGTAIDWARVDHSTFYGDRGLIVRTCSPIVLDSLRKYALKINDNDLLVAVKLTLADILKGFIEGDESTVLEAEARIVNAA